MSEFVPHPLWAIMEQGHFGSVVDVCRCQCERILFTTYRAKTFSAETA